MVEQRHKTLPGFLFAACRIRSAAWGTVPRSCARPVCGLPGFPLGAGLGSIGSAEPRGPLFADFPATLPESDFSKSYIIGYGILPFLCGPVRLRGNVETCQLPMLCVHACNGSLTPRSPSSPHQYRLEDAAFGRPNSGPRHSGVRFLDAQLPCLHAPLPTLRLEQHRIIMRLGTRG